MTEKNDFGPSVVPGDQELGFESRNLFLRAKVRPAGRDVSTERLGEWDGQLCNSIWQTRRASGPNGEVKCSARCHVFGRECPGAEPRVPIGGVI